MSRASLPEVTFCFGANLFSEHNERKHCWKRHQSIEHIAKGNRHTKRHNCKYYEAQYEGVSIEFRFFLTHYVSSAACSVK